MKQNGFFHSLARVVFKGEKVTNPPWPRMILCAVATLAPLLFGFFRGEISIAIFGGLAGYLLALNDHLGSLGHRLWVTTLSALILAFGFVLGTLAQNDPIIYFGILASVTYWLGLLGGEGAELERAVLFALIIFVTAVTTPGITTDILAPLGMYGLIAYGCLILGGPIVFFLRRDQAAVHARLRESLRISWTLKYERHIHAACFTATVLFAVWFSNEFQIEHGSGVVMTVLIVLRPDRLLTVYKTLQRFFGTLAGVLVADLIVVAHPTVPLSLLLLTVCAFVIPWALLKNYWLTTFLVTIFVVLLLEIASGHNGSLHVGTLRLQSTFIGCCLSLIGVGLARGIDRIAKHFKLFQPPA